METIREQLSKPLIAGVVGGIIGLLIGWLVIGWGIWPVTYTGAGPKDLVYPEKVEYLRTAIEAFGQNQDVPKAQARFQALGDDANRALVEISQDPQGINPQVIMAFQIAVTGAPAAAETLPPAGGVTTPVPGTVGTMPPPATPTEAPKGGSFLSRLLPILCGLIVLAGIVLVVVFYLRNRSTMPGGRNAAPMQAGQVMQPVAGVSGYPGGHTEPPLQQFMTSYKLGDDLFDDSFSIESAAGEFLGECGAGISETIGVGDPKKVTAFEVWLFDKNDIQTVTKVLMSSYAFNHDDTHQRLAAKGEPVLIEPGTEAILETQSLQMVARVVDLGYGDGALPPESYFDRFVLELWIWPKTGQQF